MTNATFKQSLNSEFKPSRDYIDDNGFLVNENVPIARAGIFRYKGYEFGMTGKNYYRDIVVYRPLSVYTPEILKNIAEISVTNDHPQDGVTPDNYQQQNIGQLSEDVYIEGDDVFARKIILKEKNSISESKAGKKQLSIGFNADYDFVPGIYDGMPYDSTEIITLVNHISLVWKGKAGDKYRLNEEKKLIKIIGDRQMLPETVYPIIFNGMSIPLSEQGAQAWNAREAEYKRDFGVINSIHAELKSLSSVVASIKNSMDEAEVKKVEKESEEVGAETKKNESSYGGYEKAIGADAVLETTKAKAGLGAVQNAEEFSEEKKEEKHLETKNEEYAGKLGKDEKDCMTNNGVVLAKALNGMKNNSVQPDQEEVNFFGTLRNA